MMSSEIKRIDELALDKVKHLVPSFEGYEGFDAFPKFYNEKDKEFYQVIFYDRSKIENRYGDCKMWLHMSIEDGDKLKEKIDLYNAELRKVQLEIANQEFKSEYSLRDYLYFSRVGSDIGICHLDMLNRCKDREDKKAQAEAEEHAHRMKTDSHYRREQEWMEEQYRPFGGAFSSQEEYLKFRS